MHIQILDLITRNFMAVIFRLHLNFVATIWMLTPFFRLQVKSRVKFTDGIKCRHFVYPKWLRYVIVKFFSCYLKVIIIRRICIKCERARSSYRAPDTERQNKQNLNDAIEPNNWFVWTQKDLQLNGKQREAQSWMTYFSSF